MTRCLDEATLQTYFDGELSGEMMESATLHLASCSTCAAAAREIQEEINILSTALADEFEVSVPTERLRERIDAAVLDLRIGTASARERTGFGAFISHLFGPQRTLSYAGLIVVLAFAAIFAIVKLRTEPQPQQPPIAQTAPPQSNKGNEQVAVATAPTEVQQPVEQVKPQITQKNTDVVYRPVKVTSRSNPTPQANQVKLLPGERAYLQTIARLDSTIKQNKKNMRPSLQVEYERNLAVVDRAIAATRSAAKSNPKDPDAADFMFAAYQSKVDLLNTIADARLGGGRPR